MKRPLLLALLVTACTGGIVDVGVPPNASVVVPTPTLDCSNSNPDPRCQPVLPPAAQLPKPRVESASLAAIYSMSGTTTLATIPPFVVPMSKMIVGPMKVRLTVTVDPKDIGTPGCQKYNTVVTEYLFTGIPPPPPPPPPPPSPGPCGSINSASAYIGFYGSASGCTPAQPACVVADAVTFAAYPMNGWGFSCSPFTYVWEFGDGSPNGIGPTPTHQFAKNGSYTVRVQITNGHGASAVFALGLDSKGKPLTLNVTGQAAPTTPPRRRPSNPPSVSLP
jgi:PKD domain